MEIYKKLLRYSFQYKYRLIFGIILSILVSIFNGASLTSLIPIFDSLGSEKNYKFKFVLTKNEKQLIQNDQEKISITRLENIELKFALLKSNLNKYFEKLSSDQFVLLFCMIIFPIYVLKLICLIGAIYLINSAGFLAVKDLRFDLYSKIQIMPMNYFIEEKTGSIMSKLINDVDVLGKLISSDLKDGIIDFFYIITHLSLLLFLSWQMFLAITIILPLIMGPVSSFTTKIRKATKSKQDRLAALNGHLQEVISGIRVIRAFSKENDESKRFYKINTELSDKTFQGHFYHQVGPSITELAGSFAGIMFLSIGAFLMDASGFSKGMFMAFFITLIFLMRPFKQMGLLFNSIQTAISAGERIFSLLERKIELSVGQNKILKLKNNICFENVSYTYPNSKVDALKNVSLTIPVGSTIALVGHSGAGKSTFIDLIPRLIDPTIGKILFDGLDIKTLSLENLRKKIGVVSQNIFLFNGTIRENISYADKNATFDDLYYASVKANAIEFIESLEDGFDTMVGERGFMLSGGQRQRLAIARTLLLDPEILILDEATSALDNESEKLVQNALEILYKNRTVIIIAHRLSTIQMADTIYYFENGEIVEHGDHRSLIEANSKYKKLFDLQFA